MKHGADLGTKRGHINKTDFVQSAVHDDTVNSSKYYMNLSMGLKISLVQQYTKKCKSRQGTLRTLRENKECLGCKIMDVGDYGKG